MGALNDTNSLLVSVLRGGRGMITRARARRDDPVELLELFEFEACPYCRKVRETLSELDLTYVSRVAARGSQNRPKLRERAGRVMFPYLIDPNTSAEMFESEDIVDYLHDQYGGSGGRSRVWRMLSPLNTAGATLAGLTRPFASRAARSGAAPEKPLELFNFEASPYCRKVREELNRRDLDCVIRNVGKGGRHRKALIERGGKMMVPYLIDPNTGAEMYESEEIVAYLRRTYA